MFVYDLMFSGLRVHVGAMAHACNAYPHAHVYLITMSCAKKIY